MRIVVDGYNAPVTAGNFVDLVQRGFYDNMAIQRADGFVVQTGDPDGPVSSRACRGRTLVSQRYVSLAPALGFVIAVKTAGRGRPAVNRAGCVHNASRILRVTLSHYLSAAPPQVLLQNEHGTCACSGALPLARSALGKCARLPQSISHIFPKASQYDPVCSRRASWTPAASCAPYRSRSWCRATNRRCVACFGSEPMYEDYRYCMKFRCVP